MRRHLRLRRTELLIGTNRYRLSQYDRIRLIAVGKAAGAMALAVEESLGPLLSDGVVVTKHGHEVSGLTVCAQMTSAHPVPDEHGCKAATIVDSFLRESNARDLILVAVSGGASALLPAPVAGISLKAKGRMTEMLLRAGADIVALNVVRKHLSRFKGGGLAALAYPATIAGLLLSDVAGDSEAVIGSGLTCPDDSTYLDALAILDRYDLRNRAPRAIVAYLEAGRNGDWQEKPRANNPIWKNVADVIVGSNGLSLAAAKQAAVGLGYKSLVLTSSLGGEAKEAARVLCEILREAVLHGSPARPPICLLAGGETTVTVNGKGRGGRNQEFVLAAAQTIAGLPNVAVVSLGTDGTDGPTDAAGAIASGETWERAIALGIDGKKLLADNDSYTFFDQLNDLIRTGPTGTNVMDVCLLLAR